MLNPDARSWVNNYLALKSSWSIWNDLFMQASARRPVPSTFLHPSHIWHYWRDHGNPYTGDPAMGAADFYCHPERVQAGLLGLVPFSSLSIDCDDTAGWVVRCAKASGFGVKMITMVDANVSMSHVIAVGIFNGLCWAIDTNGWHELPNLSEDTLCAHWNTIYKTARYIGAVETPYPFA